MGCRTWLGVPKMPLRPTRPALRIMLGSLAACVVLAISCLAFAGCVRSVPASPPPPPPVAETDPPDAEVPLSPITGKPVVKEGSPVAVSIGNNPSARPQSGLSRADIVYEVLAEGGITRYLAIYHSQAAEVVGPVRSARPYLALLAKEWGAIFGHCGGDPKDLEPIREWKVADADEFGRSDLYWRDKSRVPPDNLYTSVDNLRKAVSKPLAAPAQRHEFQPLADRPAAALRVDYGRKYVVEYRYSQEDQGYERFVIDGGKESQQKDLDTQERVLVSNVIVQFAPSRVAYSDLGLIIDLIGEGKALYLLGGRWEEGTWKKSAVEEPTLFLDAGGEPIKLTPGQTWVQIVPEGAKVDVVKEKPGA